VPKAQLTMIYKELAGYVLRHQARYVTGTVYSLEQEVTRRFLKSRAKFVQEASAVGPVDFAVICAHHEGVIFQSFDETQLGPAQDPQLKKVSPTYVYGETSTVARFVKLNLPCITLRTTFRYSGEIFDLARRFCYHYDLETAASPYKHSKQLADYNEGQFGTRSQSITIEVMDSFTKRVGPTKSPVNQGDNNVGLKLLVDIHTKVDIPYADMMVIGAYKQNKNAMSTLRDRLAMDAMPEYQGFGDLRILTIDGSQGDQAHVVVNLISNDFGIGFLKNHQRFTVLMTRPRSQAYTIFPRQKKDKITGRMPQFVKALAYVRDHLKAHHQCSTTDDLVDNVVYSSHRVHDKYHREHKGSR
jgi:hypothetical protein